MEDTRLPTPNQIVAYNLGRARRLKGWTQDEAAENLEPHIGELWSKASYSAAETSAHRNERIRRFSADEIAAFAKAFKLPITWFFLPPHMDYYKSRALSHEEADEIFTSSLETVVGPKEGNGQQWTRIRQEAPNAARALAASAMGATRAIQIGIYRDRANMIRQMGEKLVHEANLIDADMIEQATESQKPLVEMLTEKTEKA